MKRQTLKYLLASASMAFSISVCAQRVDYSVVSVPEESGSQFIRITSDADCVCMPIVKRGDGLTQHLTNTQP